VASQVFIGKLLATKAVVYLGIILVIGSLFTYQACSPDTSEHPVYLNHNENVKYVGMKTCASCHADKHSTFIHTGMGLSFDTASQAKSSALFGATHRVYDAELDLHYYPYWEADKLFIKEYRLSGSDTTHVLDMLIDYIIGSGQHTNSHLFSKNGYIYQAPITFYVQKQKWDLAPGFEGGNNSRFSRILNSECISCHNSMPKLAQGSDFKFTQIGNGIDCERCHGPGELHVKERQAGKGADVHKGIDPTIVNPRKLSWERQIDLCQRCHLQGLNVLKEDKKFVDYRPGMVLKDVFEIYLPKFEGNNSSFDMANHSQRFQMSECFIQSNKTNLSFTCISCHNPHISVKQTGREVFNTACKNCHQTKKCTETASVLTAAKNNCVTCHMPANGSEDIPHVSVHDHYIRVPKPTNSSLSTQKLIGLYAVNNATPRPQDEIKANLEYWEKFDKNPFYLNRALALLQKHNIPKLWLKYYYLKEDFAQVVRQDVSKIALSSWENFMLGESYARLKQMSSALYYLNLAYTQDPTQVIIGKQLLKYYIQDNKLSKAKNVSDYLVSEFPLDGDIANKTAQLHIMQGDLAKGANFMKIALRLDPNNVTIWLTYFNYFVKVKDKAKVIYWSDRIIAKNSLLLDVKQVAQIVDNMN
jgi:hypothetical protein